MTAPTPPPDAVTAASPLSVPDPSPEPRHAAESGGSGLFGRGLAYVAGSSLQLVSAMVVSPLLAHLLPLAEFGQLSSAIALHQVLVVFAVVGLDQAIILVRARTGQDGPARSLIPAGIVLAVGVTAVAVATQPLWSRLLGFSPGAPIVLITLAWTAPAAVLMLLLALLLSQDRLKAFTIVNVLAGVGGQVVGLTILAVTGTRTAHAYAWGNLTSLVLTAVLGLLLVRPRWRGVRDTTATRAALAVGLPIMVSGLAVFVLNASDRLVVQRVLGSAEAGRYQIAYTVGNLAVIVLTMTSAAWAPRITAVRDELARWRLIGHARDGLLRLMTAVIVGVTLGAPLVLTVVAPANYHTSQLLVVVWLVALSGFPVVVGTGSARALITLARTRALALAAIVAAVLNVVLNLLLLPSWGLAGAAAATVVGFTVQTVIHRLALPRGIAWPRTDRPVLAGAAAAVVVSGLTVLLPQDTTWNWARFAVAVLCLPWFLHQLRSARDTEESGGSAPASELAPLP